MEPETTPTKENMRQIGIFDSGDVLSPIERSKDDDSKSYEASDADTVVNDTTINNKTEEETMNQCDENESRRLNDSITSTGSMREEEILKTQEELGQTSQAFMDHLRGAAFRRKLHLTRSRDSLMAKEKHQLESIAAARAKRMNDDRQQNEQEEQAHFKAKEAPAFVGIDGAGGMVGVPKVEKRPTTTPFSPLLGARRYLRKLTGREDKLEPNEENDGLFKARPLPSTTSSLNTGYSGVPKVPKRKTTVPFSPLLGARRPEPQKPLQVRTNIDSPPAQFSKASPVGLDFLEQANLSADAHRESTRKEEQKNLAYEPVSSKRAAQRATYEEHRRLYQQERLERESLERRGQIRMLNKELGQLRPSL